MVSDDLLRREVRTLGGLLGQVIREAVGPRSLELVEEIRKLARFRRQGRPEAAAQLADRISALDLSEARIVARAFSIFFDLANLAEDRHRVRVLRERELERSPRPRRESVGDAIVRLKEADCSADEVQWLIDKLRIDLVFTAHPSEAKRRSLRVKLRRLRALLHTLDQPDLLPRERERSQAHVRAELMTLWQTDFLRPWRPTVLQEVARGLSFAPTLWETVPLIVDDLRRALEANYPGHQFRLAPILRFGSWTGGDRDGNPHVTTDVTAQTLTALRHTALTNHLAQCRRLYESLSMSDKEVPVAPVLGERLAAAAAEWPPLAEKLKSISPHERYRCWLAMVEWRLEATLAAPFAEFPPGVYPTPEALLEDLRPMCDSLRTHHGELLLDADVQAWLDQIDVFGFHHARLDVRQDSRRYREVMGELMATLEQTKDYEALPEPEKQSLLSNTLGSARIPPAAQLTPLTQETLQLFRLLRTATQAYGDAILGGHVISLTHQPSDVLTVLWLWELVCAEAREETGSSAALRIIPLFETIDDLQRAPAILEAILTHPAFATRIAEQGGELIVMIGYSDSTKDGGYLAACWWLYRAQRELCDIAARQRVKLTFFHGRGGSLGRGGGPAARSIMSLPPQALDGSLRLTEQGESLAERYDDPQIAYRHLEQVTWATMLATALPPDPIPETWMTTMDALAARSFKAYRSLVEEPAFLEYFAQATPIEEIENLPIGSRPARRRGERKLSDLRAIPWVFSWTQNRCLIPAWYGLGTALEEAQLAAGPEWQAVVEMYRSWPFFQAAIDNAILALAKADLYVAQRYATLVESPEVRQRIFSLIAAEHERSRRNLLAIVGGTDLLSHTPWLQRSIEFRNPYVDPLNLIQVELFRRLRQKAGEPEDQENQATRDLLRLTVQGVAAGMRTTG